MASEVACMRYMHFGWNGLDAKGVDQSGQRFYKFRFNPLHDYESIFWIALWILTQNSPAGSPRSSEHRRYHESVFPGDHLGRGFLLSSSIMFEATLGQDLPEPFRNLVVRLGELRQTLLNAYIVLERSRSEFNERAFADDELPLSFERSLSNITIAAPDLTFHGFEDTST